MAGPRACCLWAGVFWLVVSAASAEVLMVYSVQRHGARNVLPKTATLKESDASGGPTLLPQGQRQAYSVGVIYRDRYLNSTVCSGNKTCLAADLAPEGPEYGVVGSPDGEFNNFNTLFRSSALDRTIMTARSFLAGAFPDINQPTNTSYLPNGQQVVPVYSLPDDGDALIRSYVACPAYDARLLDWYESDEFKAKEAESEALRTEVAALAPGLNTSLTNWWNVYDGFNVYRTYNVGTPMPPVDNTTFDEMQKLAYWLETSKMRSNLTGNLLGGFLLGDLLSYFEGAAAATAANLVSPIYYKLVHLSGHYNTQLGLLGALAVDQDPAAADLTWFRKIPSLAALMAFELHASSSSGQSPADMAVRLVMQDGPSAPYTTIPLPCAQAGDTAEALAGPGACSLEAFKALAEPLAFSDTVEFCDACQNQAWTACQLANATRVLETYATTSSAGSNVDGASSSGEGGDSGLSGGAVAGIAIGCAIAGAVLAGAAFLLTSRRAAARRDRAQLAQLHQPGGLPQSV